MVLVMLLSPFEKYYLYVTWVKQDKQAKWHTQHGSTTLYRSLLPDKYFLHLCILMGDLAISLNQASVQPKSCLLSISICIFYKLYEVIYTRQGMCSQSEYVIYQVLRNGPNNFWRYLHVVWKNDRGQLVLAS